jgi:hypothetical protein
MVPKGKKKPQGRVDKVKLLNALLDGKSKSQASKIAGSLAKSVEDRIRIVNTALKDPLFAELLEKGIPNCHIVQRFKEGMDANRNIILTDKTQKGDTIKYRKKIIQAPDLAMRLNYLDRIVKLKNLTPEAPPVTPLGPNGGVFIKIDQLINDYGTKQAGGNNTDRPSNPYR